MRSLLVLLPLFLIASCSGGGGGDDMQNSALVRDDSGFTDIEPLLNGDSADRSVSNWICASRSQITGAREDYVFAIWRNGRGYSTAIGPYSWKMSDSDVEITPDFGAFSIAGEIVHDVGQDMITFRQFYGMSDVLRIACTREFSD